MKWMLKVKQGWAFGSGEGKKREGERNCEVGGAVLM